MAHPELGAKVLNGVAEQVGPLAKIEVTPRLDGRNMTMVMVPDKKAAAPRKAGASERRSDSESDVEGTVVDESAAPAAD